jgi:Bacterial PH domain
VSAGTRFGEHDDEAEPGLPAPLPAGERLLWRGAPDWRVLARSGFHLRGFALYFGVLIAWRFMVTLADGGALGAALATLLWTVPLAAMALGFIAGLAWLVARTAVYTLTDRRVVMRVGIVLTVTFNLPFSRIESAALRLEPRDPQRHGDIAITLAAGERIAYLHLWPHARPWHLKRPQPLLRAVPQADAVATLVSQAMARQAGQDAVVPQRPQAPTAPVAHGHGQPLANAA